MKTLYLKFRGTRILVAPLLAIGMVIGLTAVVMASHDRPAWLTQVFSGPTYEIDYATTCPTDQPLCTNDELVGTADGNGNGIPDNVDDMSGYLEGSRTAYVTTFGMREPYFDGAPSRPTYMTGGCWGSYNGHRMAMCAKGTSEDWAQAKSTAVHELFHGTQFAYGVAGLQPGWVIEGQAAFMEDQVFDDLDDNPGTFLFSQGNAYLSDPNRFAITATGYEIAWFWKYFAEHFGMGADPGEGISAIKTFWDQVDAGSRSGIDAVNAALAVLRPGTTFEAIYKDFVVANYARKLDGVPSQYLFPDESEAQPGPLNAVKLDVNQALPVGEQVGPMLTNVKAWGVRYFQVLPSPTLPILSINIHQDTSSRVFYDLLAIRDNQIVLEERTVGRHFSRALVNANYDKVVVIVAGLENYANFRMAFNGALPILNIVAPFQGQAAQVGDPSNPDTFIVKVEVLDPDAQPVTGIDLSTFTVTVGSQVVVTTSFVTNAYLQGQYWLLIRAPTQIAAGLYPLRVQWNSLSDQNEEAVNYAPQVDTEHVIVVDRSGSMGDANKLTAAKNAGRLYIDSWRDSEQLGVVSFNGDATVDHPLASLSTANRTAAKSGIDALVAGGSTAIGDGLITALNQLTTTADASRRWAIVLLSDGEETDDRRISDFMNIYNARKDAHDTVPEVHTIALGPDADRGALQGLAEATNGTYQFAAEPASVSAAAVDAPSDAATEFDLAELYRVIGEAVDVEQQIFSAHITIDQKKDTAEVHIPVDDGAIEGLFTVNWNTSFTSARLQLIDPSGTPVSVLPLTDHTHRFWRISDPKVGDWKLTFDCADVEICAPVYLVEVALKSPLHFSLFFNPAAQERRQGLPVQLVTFLTDKSPIAGATVSAQVTAPNGTITNVTLHDDGAHNDGIAGDGVYAGPFFQTFSAGTYLVTVRATGTSNFGTNFVRNASGAFDVAPDSDKDKDGIPGSWEVAHGTNPDQNDSNGDPDLDNASNFDEYLHGTDPNDPDTDDGGENDGSEIKAKKDPLDAKDDGNIPFTGGIFAIPGNGFTLIKYSVLPQYLHMILLRSTQSDKGYEVIAPKVAPTGVYSDTKLTNGTTYWYRIMAVGNEGSSWASDPISTTPKLDPIPPGGSVLINNGAMETSSADVQLSISALDNAPPHYPGVYAVTALDNTSPPQEMRLSNTPGFEGVPWQPYATNMAWTLAIDDGPAFVYVQFRDAAGNESDAGADAILVTNQGHIFLPALNKSSDTKEDLSR